MPLQSHLPPLARAAKPRKVYTAHREFYLTGHPGLPEENQRHSRSPVLDRNHRGRVDAILVSDPDLRAGLLPGLSMSKVELRYMLLYSCFTRGTVLSIRNRFYKVKQGKSGQKLVELKEADHARTQDHA